MAETAESSQENPDSSVARFDRDFDVNADTMSHDMDDEATLDEEETLEAAEGFNEEELDDLQKEAEVPLEDLLAFYYNPVNQREENEEHSENVDVPLDELQPEPLPLYEQAEDLTQNGLDLSPCPSPLPQDSPESQTASPSQASSIPPENQRITRGLAAAYQYFPDSDSSSSDEDYCPTEDWKKEIQIGPEHQAEVPETTCPDINHLDERSSKCLWSPKGISEVELQEYMNAVCAPSIWDDEISAAMEKGDDEQALYVLLQCKYNCEEAMKKFKAQPPPSEEMTFWSEEECRNFELGLRTNGKDFYSIQQAKIPNRTVGDIVQFYYLWKKTERHDAFSWQMRPNKKKYSFHPGITEYMDRFLDENESAASSRASSPHNSVIRPPTQSAFGTEDVNHVAPNRPPVPATTPLINPTASSGIIRIPQAYVPTPVIVTNDKEPPAKKPNLGNGDSNILSHGPPPLKSVAATTDHQIPRLHVTSHVMNVPSQLVTGMNPSESISSMGSNSLGYSSLNTRPTHHSHLNIHNIESGSSYTRLTQNS